MLPVTTLKVNHVFGEQGTNADVLFETRAEHQLAPSTEQIFSQFAKTSMLVFVL